MGADRRWPRLVAFGLLAGLVACGGSDDDAGPPPTTVAEQAPTTAATTATTTAVGTPNVAGRRDHTLDQDGEQREFIVHTPELAVGDVAAPVVFMFHGTSGDGQRFFDNSGWRELADTEGMIAVFPSALRYCFFEDENRDGDFDDRNEAKLTTKWDAGQFDERFRVCTDEEVAALRPAARAQVDHPVLDDVAFVRGMLDVLATEYTIDPQRVYASGFSNGGQMTARLAVEASDTFAAIVVAAGNVAIEAQPSAQPVPVFFSFGANDDRFTAFNGGQPLPIDASVFDNGAIASLRDDLLAVTELENTFEAEELDLGGRRVGRFVFDAGAVGETNELQVIVLEGLGHAYPRGMAAGLWAQFERFTLDDP